MDALISKALMGVFMKATQGESAVADLILAAHDKCNSADSEERQLSDLFKLLGVHYDAGKAMERGGTPCFSGPEGVCSPAVTSWANVFGSESLQVAPRRVSKYI
jgi:hypothetical protein